MHISTSYSLYDAQWLRIALSKGCTRLGGSLPENEAEQASEMLCFFE